MFLIFFYTMMTPLSEYLTVFYYNNTGECIVELQFTFTSNTNCEKCSKNALKS